MRLAVFDGDESRIWNDVQVGRMNVSENWNRRSGEKVRLMAFTNAEEAELFVNGNSCGVRRNDAPEGAKRNILSWDDVIYSLGKVEVVARNGEREVARHALETTGTAVRLVAEPEGDRWCADGYDLLYVRLRAVDAAGRTVRDAVSNVLVKVDGVARLIALDDGDHNTDQLFNVNEKRLHNGRLLAIFRAGRLAGEVRISFCAEGLPPIDFQMMLAPKTR